MCSQINPGTVKQHLGLLAEHPNSMAKCDLALHASCVVVGGILCF